MKIAVLAFLLLPLSIAAAPARDAALEPGTGGIAGIGHYMEKIEFVLHHAYESDVVVRVQVLPSFSPEFAIGIRKKERGYFVFSARPKKQIWVTETVPMMESGQIRNLTEGNNDKDLAQIKKDYPQGYQGIEVDYSEYEVSPADAHILISAFAASVTSAREPDEPSMGLDGTTYLVSARNPQGGMNVAHTWSPPEGSLPAMIVGLVRRLEQISKTGNQITETVSDARAILARAIKTPNQSSQPSSSEGRG